MAVGDGAAGISGIAGHGSILFFFFPFSGVFQEDEVRDVTSLAYLNIDVAPVRRCLHKIVLEVGSPPCDRICNNQNISYKRPGPGQETITCNLMYGEAETTLWKKGEAKCLRNPEASNDTKALFFLGDDTKGSDTVKLW